MSDVKTVEVKITDHSHSARRSLHYLNYGTYDEDDSVHFNQAHANDNGVTKRNYLVDGINCRSSYHEALHDFNTYYRKKPNNSVQTLNMILSFGRELDWSKPEDRYEGDIFARKFVARAFPNHQAVLGEQMDNTRKMSHIHLYVNALSMKPPYNTIPGGRSVHYYRMHPNAKRQPVTYGINHLRRVAQSVINDINEHDPGFTHHFDRVTKFGDHSKYTVNSGLNHVQNYVLSHVEQVMNEANVTRPQELRNELRQFGIHTSFKRSGSRRRHRRGRKRRRRRYRHGGIVFRVDTKNGHVVPYQHGLKKAKGVARHYVKSSVLGRVSDFGYRGIQRQFKLNKERPKSVILQDSGMDALVESQDKAESASSTASSATSQSDIYTKSVSVATSSVQPSVDVVASRKASAQSARDLSDSLFGSEASVIDSNSAKSLSMARNIRIPNDISVKKFNQLLTDKHSAEKHETKRVSGIMPKFSTKQAHDYAQWNYEHAIPAHLVGYDGKIPEFSIHGDDRGWLHRLTAPILDDFRKGKRWALAKWNAGRHEISGYHTIGYHEPKIVGLAKHTKLLARTLNVHTARKFHHAWKGIKSKFHDRFIQPVMAKFNSASNHASSASSARSEALSARSQAISNAKASATNATESAMDRNDRRVSLINSVEYSLSSSSFIKTSSGQASLSQDRSVSAMASNRWKSVQASKAKSNSVASSASQSDSLVASNERSKVMGRVHKHDEDRNKRNQSHHRKPGFKMT